MPPFDVNTVSNDQNRNNSYAGAGDLIASVGDVIPDAADFASGTAEVAAGAGEAIVEVIGQILGGLLEGLGSL
jgi:hypothetical protein